MSEHESCDKCYEPCEPTQSVVHIKGHPRHEACHMAQRPANWRDLITPILDKNGQWQKLAGKA